jgi:hypothetical protein
MRPLNIFGEKKYIIDISLPNLHADCETVKEKTHTNVLKHLYM